MVSTADPLSITPADLHVRRVGEPTILSPIARLVQGRVSSPHYVHESDRVLLDTLDGAEARLCDVADLPFAGARRAARVLSTSAVSPRPGS